MAMEVGASHAQVNGSITPSPAEEEELYNSLLKLRDLVFAGSHATLKLPESAIAELKASLKAQNAQDGNFLLQSGGSINGSAFATNQAQPPQSSSFPAFSGLPGLQSSSPFFQNGQSQVYNAKSSSSTTLDPIFLEKSDSLVRAEGQLKRQRLDRDLQTQVDHRKQTTREKDTIDAPSPIDVDLVLLSALERVHHVSGLKEAEKAGSDADSSFDENDYYSSQVESPWSSDAGSSKGSGNAGVAFTADFERLDGEATPKIHHKKRPSQGSKAQASGTSYEQPALVDDDDEYEPGEVLEIDDEDDDDYAPPDASAFDSSRDFRSRKDVPMVTPPEDDNSDYEPGEITNSNIPTPPQPAQQPAQKSPNVQIVRNHLTHLVAPQPNRVSPLATKGPVELELVNGRPEVVQKPIPRSNYAYSRATTASPSGNGAPGSAKKRRSKKRKRDQEPAGRTKRRRERQNNAEEQFHQEPYIKDEPMSPPPFVNVPEVPQYPPPQPYVQHRPSNLDLSSSRHAPQYAYAPEPSRSGLRYEHTSAAPPTVVRVASPASPAYRPVQRDTQDLRRVASLQHAHRPPSPRTYSPSTQYRTVSMPYGDPRSQQLHRPEENLAPKYVDASGQEVLHYPRAERSRSPPRIQEFSEPYAERVGSAAMMPPPNTAPRPYVVDQYGNKYYAAEPAPPSTSMPPPRASVAPAERRLEGIYDQPPSRGSGQYPHYDPADRMAPPPPSRRTVAPEPQPEYVDNNAYSARQYSSRAAEPPRYAPAPTSPIYQEVRGYEQMPPPPAPAQAREPTSPVYASRSYSVRPEEPPQQRTNYMRHASVAPATQYIRQEAPAPAPIRAASVMPGLEFGSSAQGQPQQHPAYTQAPQNVRYVDQYGREVFPQQVRQEFRYQ